MVGLLVAVHNPLSRVSPKTRKMQIGLLASHVLKRMNRRSLLAHADPLNISGWDSYAGTPAWATLAINRICTSPRHDTLSCIHCATSQSTRLYPLPWKLALPNPLVVPGQDSWLVQLSCSCPKAERLQLLLLPRAAPMHRFSWRARSLELP